VACQTSQDDIQADHLNTGTSHSLSPETIDPPSFPDGSVDIIPSSQCSLPNQHTRHSIELVDAIFKLFSPDLERGFFEKQSRIHKGTPSSTIRNWYHKWEQDRDWRPYRADRAISHRTFTDEQEDKIVAELRTNFWERDSKLSSRTFTAVVSQFWIRHRTTALNSERFAGSSRFRRRFFQRNDLSLRTPTVRTSVPRRSQTLIDDFLEKLRVAEERYGPDRIINMDETSWKDVHMSGKTISKKGARSVRVTVQGNTKSCISAVCTVSMSGDKYPPLYILKGLQERVIDSLEPAVPRARVTLSRNGWMDETIMLKYLSWIKIALRDAAFALVLDSYPAHITPRVRDKAARMGIEMIPVPRGLTGEYQPLDRSCFGPLKKTSQRFWDDKARTNPELKWTHEQGANLLEESWSLLARETIQHGWRFTVDADSLSIPEPDMSGDLSESFDVDKAYREPESEETEPGSTGTWDNRFERVDRVRARASQNRTDPVIEVDASLHDLPAVHPEWDERAWTESSRRERTRARDEKELMRAQDRLQEKHDAEIHGKWVFPEPCGKRFDQCEPPIGPDGFLFLQWRYDRHGN
jgi:hypothetical protein